MPEYLAWANMRRRCLNPNHPQFRHYGGRVIGVTIDWQSYEQFLADMGPRPTPRHTLERIDNNGHYTRDNCRWATRRDQARNKRTNVLVEIDGKVACAKDWCIYFGINYATYRNRIRRSGLTPDAALKLPIQNGWRRKF